MWIWCSSFKANTARLFCFPCDPKYTHTHTHTHTLTLIHTHGHTCGHTHTHTHALHLIPTAEGFGNATRIDYGTGHEAKFVAFLCCLMKIGVILREDAAAVVLVVMNK